MLAVTALGLIVLAIGRHTAIGRAVAALPLLDTFRFPVKAMVPCALAIALLAGMGFESLREEVGRPGWRRALVVPLLVLLALALGGAAWLALDRAATGDRRSCSGRRGARPPTRRTLRASGWPCRPPRPPPAPRHSRWHPLPRAAAAPPWRSSRRSRSAISCARTKT